MFSLTCLVLAAGLSTGSGDALHASEDWSYRHAAHLLRRAGFGGTPEQIAYLHGLGRRGAVNYLVDYERVGEPPEPLALPEYEGPIRRVAREAMEGDDLSREERQRAIARLRQRDRIQFARVVSWWIEQMIATPRPLEEKLTLFWHGHFTSGYREVKSSYALYWQNDLLRRHASGNFREFLNAITEDAAMVLYLNTQQNRKNKPNENYARELLELFTLGAGHYSEQDIKEAARAFTGIMINPSTGRAFYHNRQHDFGEKNFLGETGDFEPADIIDIILKQQRASEFVAARLWTFFAYEAPEAEIVEALGGVFRENNYEIKPVLRAMFASDAFYGERAMLTHIKSPVELLVGTVRTLEMDVADMTTMVRGLASMGQTLMMPPNVKGWDGGEAWITTSTLANRYNVIGQLIAGTDGAQSRREMERMRERIIATLGDEGVMMDMDFVAPQPAYDPMPKVRELKLNTASRIVDHYLKVLLQRRLPRERQATLVEALQKSLKNKKNVMADENADAVRGLIHLIASMPEYQLS